MDWWGGCSEIDELLWERSSGIGEFSCSEIDFYFHFLFPALDSLVRVGSPSWIKPDFAMAPSLWSFWRGWKGSIVTVNSSCGTDPIMAFHQGCILRQGRKCCYSGQLLP